jgi:hypothetical protein
VAAERPGAVLLATTGTANTAFVQAFRTKAQGVPLAGLSVTVIASEMPKLAASTRGSSSGHGANALAAASSPSLGPAPALSSSPSLARLSVYSMKGADVGTYAKKWASRRSVSVDHATSSLSQRALAGTGDGTWGNGNGNGNGKGKGNGSSAASHRSPRGGDETCDSPTTHDPKGGGGGSILQGVWSDQVGHIDCRRIRGQLPCLPS